MLFTAGQRFSLVARNVSQGLRCLSCASAISDGRSMAGEGHLEAAFDELELAPTSLAAKSPAQPQGHRHGHSLQVQARSERTVAEQRFKAANIAWEALKPICQ
ncbi:hypothetical protein HaLaN_12075 [Haematococcus lacustris]|uniref:Uncharacterized protein n=1 Tax=Haematococcus lacustris TaxID=44745 RepID=A0A699Z183_HAELA|nr:hypothetical protein HaLaN_12075 [Haematococcus lacustris]